MIVSFTIRNVSRRTRYPLYTIHPRTGVMASASTNDGPYLFLGHNFILVDVVFASFWQLIPWVGQHYSLELIIPTSDDDTHFIVYIYGGKSISQGNISFFR